LLQSKSIQISQPKSNLRISISTKRNRNSNLATQIQSPNPISAFPQSPPSVKSKRRLISPDLNHQKCRGCRRALQTSTTQTQPHSNLPCVG
jgi:hypothetical protein